MWAYKFNCCTKIKGTKILSWGEILSCAKIACFKVMLDVVIERCSEKKMFLKSYSSTAVKSSGGKYKTSYAGNNTLTLAAKLTFEKCSK